MGNPNYGHDLRKLDGKWDLSAIVTKQTILIVVGMNLCAELLDRPLAEQVRDAIDSRGNAEEGRRSIIVTDAWWLREEWLQRQPTISIGGPPTNSVSGELATALEASRGPNDLPVPDCGVFRPSRDRLGLWEGLAAGTASRVRGFLDNDLAGFLGEVWNR